MTLGDVYRKGEEMLADANIPDADVDAACLMELFFGCDRARLIIHGDEKADDALTKKFFSAIEERKTGKPLQYIAGVWNFMGYDFYVGEGVLIPRDDTEILAEEVCSYLYGKKDVRAIDLCSGSGAIAITVAKANVNSEVTALEYSENALKYLKKNIELNNADNVVPFAGDVTKCADSFNNGYFDLIVSNPPYIRTDVLPTLQKEVQFEPMTALDGGQDGLQFYRCIAEHWTRKLKPGGGIVLEIGEEQAQAVTDLLSKHDITDIQTLQDIQELDRVIFGTKKR